VDFARGGTASAIFKPAATIATWTGRDPNKMVVPLSGTVNLSGKGPLFTKNRTLGELSEIPKDEEGQETMGGQLGDIVGQTAQFVALPEELIGTTPLKVAKIINQATKSQKLGRFAGFLTRAATDAAIAGGQTALQKNEPVETANAMITSALLSGPAYKGTKAFGNWMRTKGAKWYETALGIPQATSLSYGKELVDHGLNNLDTVDKAGLKEVESRFSKTVDAMKKASAEAEAKGKMIDTSGSKIRFDAYMNDLLDVGNNKKTAQETYDKLSQQFFGGPSPVALTPTKVEDIKEKINKTLTSYYKNVKDASDPQAKVIDEVLNTFISGLRDGQKAGITDKIKFGGKELLYGDLAKLASLDADLASLINRSLRGQRSAGPGLASMIEGSAYGSLLKGSLATPAQIGWAEKHIMTPSLMSGKGPSLIEGGKRMTKTGAIPIQRGRKNWLPNRGLRVAPTSGAAISRLMGPGEEDQSYTESTDDFSSNPYK
jgi:hypothetical protein